MLSLYRQKQAFFFFRAAAWLIFSIVAFVAAVEPDGGSARIILVPRLRAGQTLSYQLSYSSKKQTKTESGVALSSPLQSENLQLRARIVVHILNAQASAGRQMVHARAEIEILDSDLLSPAPDSLPAKPGDEPANRRSAALDFTILPDGRIGQVTGIDALLPAQQRTWQQWTSRFTLGAALSGSSVKLGQKWKSDEPEKSPSPISGLLWQRESTYVRNESCPSVHSTEKGELVPSNNSAATCAVILTAATLKQHSSPDDATPPDFKLHQLHTEGRAKGSNRIITYISLTSGLVVSAREDADQSMDVTISKLDDSNSVHYEVTATSQSEILLIEN